MVGSGNVWVRGHDPRGGDSPTVHSVRDHEGWPLRHVPEPRGPINPRPNGSVTARLRRQVTETSAALEAVTKERDDARDQLARVCAQVETLGAEVSIARAALAHRVAYTARDTRILDCVATLLAMREAP